MEIYSIYNLKFSFVNINTLEDGDCAQVQDALAIELSSIPRERDETCDKPSATKQRCLLGYHSRSN